MKVSLIVAASTNNAIGKNNQLLWHLPNDLKFFKNTTWGMPMAMGRKTYESMGNQALQGRMNIVITRQQDWSAKDVVTVSSIQEAIQFAQDNYYKELFVAGGGEIYKQAITIANRIYITRVHAVLEGDTFFPAIDETEWKLVSSEDHPADEKHAYAYSFQVWDKI